MFYLTKRIDEKQCTVGERCMTLSDWPGVPAGTKATVVEIYNKGIMIEWDARRPASEYDRKNLLRDGFSRNDLQYLAFETKCHPKVDPTVTNINHAE